MLRDVTERYTPLTPETLTRAQKPVYDAIAAARHGSVPKPFHVFLQSPELADRAQQLGALVRYRTGLPARLSEIAILVTAKHWEAQYEWSVHEGEARKAGVTEEVIRAIASGARPVLAGDDAVVYDFATSFYTKRDVPDDVFKKAVDAFGQKTVVELAAILGYYSMLAIVMGIYRVRP
jgi:4-carboxymuconolactone decarboxylase